MYNTLRYDHISYFQCRNEASDKNKIISLQKGKEDCEYVRQQLFLHSKCDKSTGKVAKFELAIVLRELKRIMKDDPNDEQIAPNKVRVEELRANISRCQVIHI
jgi:hypothetical protein